MNHRSGLIGFVIGFCVLEAACSIGSILSGDSLPETPPKATFLPFDPEEITRFGKFGHFPDRVIGPNFHGGIDMFPFPGKTATFYAIAPGRVDDIDPDTHQGYDGDKGARNWRITIAISKTVIVGYHFEAALDESTKSPLSVAEVKALIHVKEGQSVTAGQPISDLPYRCSSSHVHFSIIDSSIPGGEHPGMPSPLTYFDSATKAELEKLDLEY